MKSLIVYYSHSGNNEKLAHHLKDKTGWDIFKINEVKERKTISILLDFMVKRDSKLDHISINLEDYVKIIFIGPVWGGKIASPLRSFMELEKNNVGKYAFIGFCNGVEGQKDKLDTELKSILRHEPMLLKELWINLLLPEDKRNKIKHTFSFKVTDSDLERFREDIEEFISSTL
jgi:flavodoxin